MFGQYHIDTADLHFVQFHARLCEWTDVQGEGTNPYQYFAHDIVPTSNCFPIFSGASAWRGGYSVVNIFFEVILLSSTSI